ncbi:putative pentatricopeptide repeat-containing protein, partial [Tanacetum coccineum]
LVRNKQQIRGDSKTRMAVIWNPTVRKSVGIVVIPKVGYKRTIVGFGVCPDTSDPKLVKISVPFKTCDLMMLQFVNGVIYFRASDFNFVNQVRTNFIISFDLKSGKFGEVCLPQRLVHTPYLNLDVVKVNESLGLLEYYKEGDMRVCGVWTRKDDASKTFSKIYIVKYRIEVYEPLSGIISGVGINGNQGTFSVRSYMETLLLLDQSDSIIH